MKLTEAAVVLIALICVKLCHSENVQKCPEGATCVRFCCDNCTDFDISDQPGADKLNADFQAIHGKTCDESYRLESENYVEDEWSLLPNGSVRTESEIFTTEKYCLRRNTEENQKWMMLVCYPEKSDQDFLYPILMLLSIPFSMATFLVYSWIKELRNLHGKCLMGYVFTVILLHLVLALIQLNYFNHGTSCTIAGYFLYFAVFSPNFWLNVMSFDIWRTFRNFRVSSDVEKRFNFYAIYAFCTPALMTVILIFLDNVPSEALDGYRPEVGQRSCSIHSTTHEKLYYLFPMILVNFFSALFFVLATFHFFKRSTMENFTGYTRLDAERDRFIMYVKLFAFMMIIWSFEIISNFVDYDGEIIPDVVHCLQGVVIFTIFVLHKNTRDLIKKEYAAWKGGEVQEDVQDEVDQKDVEVDPNFKRF